MTYLSLDEIKEAAELVYRFMSPTPQYAWPLLCEELGCTVWAKHENHGPTGAFKARGGIVFIDWLKRTHPGKPGIITATRGNHGQSQARAATMAGLRAKILVPFGNSVEKNAAMRAFGGEVIEFGQDFDQARLEAMRLADAENLFPVSPFHKELVRGVATYALEFFTAVPDLDVVYVPIGCGSGVCGVIEVRDGMGLKTEVVGVVAERAQAAKLSFEAKRLIETERSNTFADGMAVRVPVQEAFDIYSKRASRIVAVSEEEIASAMRLCFRSTHNVIEGAGAGALAALIKEKGTQKGKKAGVIFSGGNIDTSLFADVLRGGTPKVD